MSGSWGFFNEHDSETTVWGEVGLDPVGRDIQKEKTHSILTLVCLTLSDRRKWIVLRMTYMEILRKILRFLGTGAGGGFVYFVPRLFYLHVFSTQSLYDSTFVCKWRTPDKVKSHFNPLEESKLTHNLSNLSFTGTGQFTKEKNLIEGKEETGKSEG